MNTIPFWLTLSQWWSIVHEWDPKVILLKRQENYKIESVQDEIFIDFAKVFVPFGWRKPRDPVEKKNENNTVMVLSRLKSVLYYNHQLEPIGQQGDKSYEAPWVISIRASWHLFHYYKGFYLDFQTYFVSDTHLFKDSEKRRSRSHIFEVTVICNLILILLTEWLQSVPSSPAPDSVKSRKQFGTRSLSAIDVSSLDYSKISTTATRSSRWDFVLSKKKNIAAITFAGILAGITSRACSNLA